MPKKRKKELIQCQFFHWKLGNRNGVFFADGRSGNQQNLGRHSLGTKEINQARMELKELDKAKAIELGLVTREAAQQKRGTLTIRDGWDLYKNYLNRTYVAGGARASTVIRYKSIFDKFIQFTSRMGIQHWNQVGNTQLEQYLTWLDKKGTKVRTLNLEGTTIKQCMKMLITTGALPNGIKLTLPLKKAQGSTTYCWKPEEVAAIVSHCQSRSDLSWLGDIIIALATTGLRISELASLRWTDVNAGMITLTDETSQTRGSSSRTTKSGRDRSFPVHPDLAKILQHIPRHRDGLIFHGPLGGVLLPDTLRTILKRDVLAPLEHLFPSSANTIGFKDGRIHSFRHYFCSVCADKGVSELMLMCWLGHADSSMVRHYYHMNNREAQRQMMDLQFIRSAGSKVLPATPRLEDALANGTLSWEIH